MSSKTKFIINILSQKKKMKVQPQNHYFSSNITQKRRLHQANSVWSERTMSPEDQKTKRTIEEPKTQIIILTIKPVFINSRKHFIKPKFSTSSTASIYFINSRRAQKRNDEKYGENLSSVNTEISNPNRASTICTRVIRNPWSEM